MDRSRSRGDGLVALSVLLLLAALGARCSVPRVRLARRLLPPEYEARLQVLKLALALNEEWSPVWSEKLNRDAVAEWHPDPEFCMRLTPAAAADDTSDAEAVAGGPVDAYETVRDIVNYCPFSGMYVRFGLRLIGASVQCLFNRFAQIDLSAVAAMVEDADDRFHEYLRELVTGYQEIADKLAVVGESLHNLLQLVTFFDDVEKQSAKLAKEPGNRRRLAGFYAEVKDVAGKIATDLDADFDSLCAVDELNWWDKVNGETVGLEEFKDKNKKKKKKKKKKDKKKNKKKKDKKDKDEEDDEEDGEQKDNKEKKDKKKDEGDDKEKGEEEKDKDKEKKKEKKFDKLIERANNLRKLMRNVFEQLLIREMPSEMWKEIFTMNILMKPDDIKQLATSAPKKKATEDIAFEL